MNTFLKVVAGMLIGLILWICLQKQEKDMALLLSLLVCVMGAAAALKTMEPVLDLLRQLEGLGRLQEGILGILLKAAGTGLVTELAAMVCHDSGNSAMEKTVRLLGSVTMLTLALPVFQTLLQLLQEILNSI